METQTRGKGTIDHRLRGSVGILDDMNPTRLSKQSQGCPLTGFALASIPMDPRSPRSIVPFPLVRVSITVLHSHIW